MKSYAGRLSRIAATFRLRALMAKITAPLFRATIHLGMLRWLSSTIGQILLNVIRLDSG